MTDNTWKPIIKPEDIWCNSNLSEAVPPTEPKKAIGWRYGEIPRHTTFNWAGNISTSFLAHSCKYGIPVWDIETSYYIGSVVLGYDDATSEPTSIYIAKTNNVGQNPGTSPNDWREYQNTLSSIKDVNLDGLQTGFVLKYYDESLYTSSESPKKYWKNIPSTSIASLKSLNDVDYDISKTNHMAILSAHYISENGYDYATDPDNFIWSPMPFGKVLEYMDLNDLADVNIVAPEAGQVLGYLGGLWENIDMDVDLSVK
jgi:hypothetical protein